MGILQPIRSYFQNSKFIKESGQFIIVIALGFSVGAIAQSVGFVKHSMVAQAGACSKGMSENEAMNELASNGMSSPGASSQEVVALGETMARINALNGGKFSPLQNVTVKFDQSAINNKGKRVTHSFMRSSKTVQMCRGHHHHVGNVGYLAHELGHLVGNSEGGRWYSSYKSRVPDSKPCHVSGYAAKNYPDSTPRNEEFAEAFAAFVANPSLLENAGGGCKEALNFFQSQFRAGKVSSCTVQDAGTIQASANPWKDIEISDEAHSAPDETQEKAKSLKEWQQALKPSPYMPILGQGMGMLMQMYMVNQNAKAQAAKLNAAAIPTVLPPTNLTPATTTYPR